MKLRQKMCLVLVFLVFASFTTAYAEEFDENPLPDTPDPYTGVSSVGAYLSIDPSGKATCTGMLVVQSGYSVSMDLILEQYAGSSWDEIKTWSVSSQEQIILSRTRYVPSGNDYRVEITVKVYDESNNLVEDFSSTSFVVHY